MYVSPGEGSEDGDGGGREGAGSVLIERGQRENPQVCRKNNILSRSHSPAV